MTVKVVRGVVPTQIDNLSASTRPPSVAQQAAAAGASSAQAAQTSAQAVTRTLQNSDAVVTAIRTNARVEKGAGALKDFEKAEKLADEVRDEILKGGSKSVEDTHSGIKSSNASYHLN